MLMAMTAHCAQQDGAGSETFGSPEAMVPMEVPEIAELSDRMLNAMTNEELVAVIQAADRLLPRPMRDRGRLALKDRATLQRMACLARRACRNRCSVR